MLHTRSFNRSCSVGYSRHLIRMRSTCSNRGLYDCLGIPINAGREEILFSYTQILDSLRNKVSSRASARKQFASACVAYEILSNVDLRELYDVEGISGLPKDYQSLLNFLSYDSEMNDKGTVRTVHCINLELAIFGGPTEVVVKTRKRCTTCHGKDDVRQCVACEGSGRVVITSPAQPLGSLGTCPVCGGDGCETRTFCRVCRGKGEIEVHKRINLSIPPGVETGTVLHLAGFGGQSLHSSTETGDVLIGLVVNRHSQYRRCGMDIHSLLKVPYTMAILGGNMYVTTIWGYSPLKIPSGAQHGQKITLQGGGIRDEDGCIGNHIFEVKLSLPRVLNDETVPLLEKLYELSKLM